jgi:hypothetical protein
MNIAEIRSSLDAQFAQIGGFPSSAPDWVVKRIYQKSENLPLSPVPTDTRRFNTAAEFRSVVAQRKMQAKPATRQEVTETEREAVQRRVLLASIAILQ